MTNEERDAALAKELESLLNRHSVENGSDTPDFLLAEYLMQCLAAWNKCVRAREHWYGRTPSPAPAPLDR